MLPSVRSHGTLAMIMVNLAKSWLTMVPLSRSWLIMIHGTLAKIMARSWQDLGKITMVSNTENSQKTRICYHGTLGKNMGNHGILAKIMVSLCTILHGHGILAKIMARSWQDLGKATKELAMDLGKDAMVSNTGFC